MFTNPTLIHWEYVILKTVEFDLIGNNNFAFDTLLVEYLLLVKPIFPNDKFSIFAKTAEIIFEVLIVEGEDIRTDLDDGLVCIAVIHTALVLLT